MKRLLIAGCGDLGMRLATRLPAGIWQVTGLRRNPQSLPADITPVAADLLDPASLGEVVGAWDAVVYQATPGQRSPLGYRQAYVEGLANLLQRISADRLLFVSSTAVYGQDDGGWVDEESSTEPTAFNGQILLEAEAAARAAGGTVVRFSGIYGPGRDYLLRQLRSGQASCREAPPQWTNRIHADDCAGVLAHLLELADPAPIYCASDCCPTRRCELLDWLADRLGQPRPARTDPSEGQGKRVSNRRLLASGYDFRYPDFKCGYGALLT
jgi:nucleoside-diphosphate-sugar epimerase